MLNYCIMLNNKEYSFTDYNDFSLYTNNSEENNNLSKKVYFINQNNMYIKEEEFENSTDINFILNNSNEFKKQTITNDILKNKKFFSSISTEDVTENKNNIIIEEKKNKTMIEEKKESDNIIFFKVNKLKSKGRKKKSKKDDLKNNLNQLIINKNKKELKVHSKIDKDNLIRKIRIHAIKFANDLLNNCIKIDFGKNTRRKIREIIQELTSDITISFNIQFLNSTLERIFSNPLNEKYKKLNENHNINEIKKIRKKINEAPLTNELLNITFIEIYNWFIQKGNYKFYYDRYGKDENTHNLNEFLNTINESDDYINLLKQTGINFIQFFTDTKARKVNKKRKIKFKNTNFEGYY